MKKVEAIIKPFKLEDVKNSLSQLGVQGITVSEIQGCGRQKGHAVMYRGSEYTTNLVPKVKIEVVVPDGAVASILQAIVRAAQTGEIGDGKIFVHSVEAVKRIRTGETGESAL